MPDRAGPTASHPAVPGRVYVAAGDAGDLGEAVREWFAGGGRVMVLNEDGTDRQIVEGSAQLVEVFNAELLERDPQDLGIRLVR